MEETNNVLHILSSSVPSTSSKNSSEESNILNESVSKYPIDTSGKRESDNSDEDSEADEDEEDYDIDLEEFKHVFDNVDNETGDLDVLSDKIIKDNAGSSSSDRRNEKDYISQFLKGELTFSEYAARMEVDDEDDDDVGICVALPSEPSPEELPDKDKVKHHKTKKKGAVKRTRYVRKNLPPVLKGLMGEANLRYARGDKDIAVKICLEIIRQVPTAPEPYQTLAGLYEELGYADKSLQMALIAAHLSPSDPDQWIHLAELSQEKGNLKQAVTCYTKAIKADRKNIDIHFKRAELLEKVGHRNIALNGFTKLLSVLGPDEGEKILVLSKLVAEMYHKEKDLVKTKETLQVAFEKCPQLVTSEHINLLLEVLLGLKDYSGCLEVLVTYCDLEAELEMGENNVLMVLHCKVKQSMPIDIMVKLILALIYLKSMAPVNQLLNILLSANAEEVGDLYLDVAEALMTEGFHSDAVRLLLPLINSSNYSLPAVWLRYGECLKTLGNIEDSVKAYQQVIKQAPQHHEARLVAAELLTSLGRRDEAIVVLTQDEKCDYIDAGLLYERCLLLRDKVGHVDDFLTVSQLFFSRHFVQIRAYDELRVMSMYSRIYRKKAALRDLRMSRGDLILDDIRQDFTEGKKVRTAEEEWDLFMYVCNLCFKEKRFALLQRLAFSAQGSEKFTDYFREIDTLCLMSSYYNGDSYNAFTFSRSLVLKDVNCVRAWNLFNVILIRGNDGRHNRFLMRLLARNQSHLILSLLHANNCLVSGTYKYALNEYVAAFRREPTPMLAFLIGVTLCQMACQKFSAKKHSLVSQVVAFFNRYKELRGPTGEQEFNYNLGRVYHQLGLLSSAIFHYKVALDCEPPRFGSKNLIFDLRREIAFNLHLIYLSSGACDIARMYLQKYVVV